MDENGSLIRKSSLSHFCTCAHDIFYPKSIIKYCFETVFCCSVIHLRKFFLQMVEKNVFVPQNGLLSLLSECGKWLSNSCFKNNLTSRSTSYFSRGVPSLYNEALFFCKTWRCKCSNFDINACLAPKSFMRLKCLLYEYRFKLFRIQKC